MVDDQNDDGRIHLARLLRLYRADQLPVEEVTEFETP